MSSIYDMSEKNGLILHAEGCSILLKECERIYLKLKKRIAKQEEKRKAEFAEIFSYRSVDEICDAYGYDLITDNQRRKYIELFEKGKEALDEPLENKDTAALDILLRFTKQLRFEIEQDRFDALSPEEQAEEIRRSEESLNAWKEHKKEIKKMLKMEE
ncbi:MAG: adenylosuccinate lyase [Tyzzerella sp.]|nr:adenylosuccinate lyase [Tyzzerella sp.]